MIIQSQWLSGTGSDTSRPGVESTRRLGGWAIALAALSAACGAPVECPRCETLIIAASIEPDALFPPLVGESTGRDVSDLIFERLALLRPGGSPMDSGGYRPGLASRWDRLDSLTVRFTLRKGARWHDGVPVTAGDVAFSFEAYADSSVDTQARGVLAGRVSATAIDDSTILVHFTAPDPEQWYDATWHVRILPRHIWDSMPRTRWASDTNTSHLVGSGPYRLATWHKGQSLRLERVEGDAHQPAIRAVVWRFAGDQDAALNLLQSHEADLLESIGDSARVARVIADPALTTIEYPSAVYGFLGFNLGGRGDQPVHVLEVRRALALATDRATAARAVLGRGAVAPPGPMSRILWINDPGITVTAFDTAAAAATLDAAGWRRGPDGVRRRSGRVLAVDILVPGSSVARRNLAQVVQEMWRRVGVAATVTSVDFPVFQERLRTGRFQSFVGAWLDEPSPRGLGDQWTSKGIGGLNYTRYRSARFDSLFQRAAGFRGDSASAQRAWQEAITQLNADVPAIWLYSPMNVAGVSKRVHGIEIDPYSWLSGLPEWSVGRP
jgi:peptide/nickel transport system substrate-binding protein